MRDVVQNKLTDQKLQQETLKDFVMNLLRGPKLEQRKTEIIHDELADESKNWIKRT